MEYLSSVKTLSGRASFGSPADSRIVSNLFDIISFEEKCFPILDEICFGFHMDETSNWLECTSHLQGSWKKFAPIEYARANWKGNCMLEDLKIFFDNYDTVIHVEIDTCFRQERKQYM